MIRNHAQKINFNKLDEFTKNLPCGGPDSAVRAVRAISRRYTQVPPAEHLAENPFTFNELQQLL
ncbi:hypothetical protein [Janthinobacterium sp. ROICE36]|uniref:hypothetical protein n=1 Tax=Janthinobacterium sp. ROICE36 TaxID=2048670 RepID=UPI0011AF6EF1|nr:hypothetical protein [Janthinobacterium sp. ROICE36]